ncbi:hypothetical protein, conserved in T. vivax [Trypanosoma vivax Y486]|uniref:Variant surface glycoprotein (VSG) n=1 Tax=Trypanosoma vivax (strain Y486) TaxID=1055687 RepID=F9WQE3_TRYVY|nr:hypothetical protein, conserved in T. vivax [Trypanosoma vivax Y486]|eukprot:CCD19771.1 hypothetical protein, conserved in T. vivax [Trypanosoma vivax Y486]
MKRFWTSLLGFASLLALLSANKAQGGAAKGVKRSSAQGACSFATALDAVARAAELAATEAAERSANASAWQQALATALSKTNNATAVDALGTAAKLQSMNAQVGADALSLAREAAAWAVDIRSAVFAFSALSGGGGDAALCISKENDSNEKADFSNHGEEYAFEAICGPKPAEVEALARRTLAKGVGAMFDQQDGILPNLTRAVIAPEVDRTFAQPESTTKGIKTGGDANEGQACPLVVYRSKGSRNKHGGIIAGNGPSARTLIWGRWWRVTPAHHSANENHDGPKDSNGDSKITIDDNATQTWTNIKSKLAALRTLIANVQKECTTEAGNLCAPITKHDRETLQRMATPPKAQATSTKQTTRNKGAAQQHNGHPQGHDTAAETSTTCPTGTRWNQGTEQCETDGTGKAPQASSAHSTSAHKTLPAALLLATLRTTQHI